MQDDMGIELELAATEPGRRIDRAEYLRMLEAGVFGDLDTELLFGVVVLRPGQSPEHMVSVQRVFQRLDRQIGDRAETFCQAPYVASEISFPQPDVYVVPKADYWGHVPDRAYLVVEVSRSSINRDRNVKAPLYAQGNVDEYWIVNHEERVVEVHREAVDGTWRRVTRHGVGETVSMARFPDVRVAVADLLPPGEIAIGP